MAGRACLAMDCLVPPGITRQSREVPIVRIKVPRFGNSLASFRAYNKTRHHVRFVLPRILPGVIRPYPAALINIGQLSPSFRGGYGGFVVGSRSGCLANLVSTSSAFILTNDISIARFPAIA